MRTTPPKPPDIEFFYHNASQSIRLDVTGELILSITVKQAQDVLRELEEAIYDAELDEEPKHEH